MTLDTILLSLAPTLLAVAVIWGPGLWRKLRAQSKNPARELSKIARRVKRLRTEELPGQAEVLLVEAGRGLSVWRRSGDKVHLDDVLLAAEALTCVLNELRQRGL